MKMSLIQLQGDRCCRPAGAFARRADLRAGRHLKALGSTCGWDWVPLSYGDQYGLQEFDGKEVSTIWTPAVSSLSPWISIQRCFLGGYDYRVEVKISLWNWWLCRFQQDSCGFMEISTCRQNLFSQVFSAVSWTLLLDQTRVPVPLWTSSLAFFSELTRFPTAHFPHV